MSISEFSHSAPWAEHTQRICRKFSWIGGLAPCLRALSLGVEGRGLSWVRGLNQRICRKFAGPAWPAHREGVATPKSRFQVGKRQKDATRDWACEHFLRDYKAMCATTVLWQAYHFLRPQPSNFQNSHAGRPTLGGVVEEGVGVAGGEGLWQRICRKFAGFRNRPSAWPVLAWPLLWRREGVGWGGGRREECGSESANLLQIRWRQKAAWPCIVGWTREWGVGWVEEGRQKLGELSQPGPAWDGRASLRTSLQNKTLLASVCYPETDFHAGLSNHDLQKRGGKQKWNQPEFAANSLDFPFGLPSTSPRTVKGCHTQDLKSIEFAANSLGLPSLLLPSPQTCRCTCREK